jgi:hypothetical protein
MPELLHCLLDLGNIGLRRGDEDALFSGCAHGVHFVALPRSVVSTIILRDPPNVVASIVSLMQARRAVRGNGASAVRMAGIPEHERMTLEDR